MPKPHAPCLPFIPRSKRTPMERVCDIARSQTVNLSPSNGRGFHAPLFASLTLLLPCVWSNMKQGGKPLRVRRGRKGGARHRTTPVCATHEVTG